MPAHHEGHSLSQVALAVHARYVSTSLLAEGKEGTRRVLRAFDTWTGRASRGVYGASLDSIQG